MKYNSDFSQNAQPIQFMEGTNAEDFVLGEVLRLNSGVLTKGAVDSDGVQQYICMAAVKGATGIKNVPVVQIRKDAKFATVSSATVAKTLIGAAVELNADAVRVTATTTKGVFVIDETDGATTNSKVVGHFISAAAV
jgi:hypothetical protein